MSETTPAPCDANHIPLREGDLVRTFLKQEGRVVEFDKSYVSLRVTEGPHKGQRICASPNGVTIQGRPPRPGDVLRTEGRWANRQWRACVLDATAWPSLDANVTDGRCPEVAPRPTTLRYHSRYIHENGLALVPEAESYVEKLADIAKTVEPDRAVAGWTVAKSAAKNYIEYHGYHDDLGKPERYSSPAPKPRILAMTAERIAKAMFKTDSRVVAFLRQVSDDTLCEGGAVTFKWGVEAKILAKMWARDEKGWRTEAEKRAAEIFAILDNEDLDALQRNSEGL